MYKRHLAFCLAIFALFVGAHAAGEEVNLLPNGGFEKDADGDGVADGWTARDFNFSNQTREEVQAYIDNLPSWEDLLKQDQILASDGTVLYEREADGSFRADRGSDVLKWRNNERSWKPEENWYARLRGEFLWQHARFGEPPIPDGLELGEVTLVLSPQRPHKQVVSEPIAVKPDTGYRLVFFVRTSGGTEFWGGPQVLDGAYDAASIPIRKDSYGNPKILNAIPAKEWWGSGIAGRYWAGMELPFRTGPKCKSIVIRLPYIHRDEAERRKMHNESYRMWYDDLRLVEDASVLGAGPTEVRYDDRPEPEWPADAVERGFVVAPRPASPMTYAKYVPTLEETREPIRLALSAGETDSAVIFVRALGKALTVQARPATLVSGEGYGIPTAYGARFFTLRAAEMAPRFLNAKRGVRTPKFLLNSATLEIGAGDSGQFWLTVAVSPGTPPGEYVGEVKVTRVNPADDGASAGELSVPVTLTVRDIDLEEADVAFFTWYHPTPASKEYKLGPSYALPGSDEIYLADQRRHGMNTSAVHCQAERRDKDGVSHITFNELDAQVTSLLHAGLCRRHPFLLHTWSEGSLGGDFCSFAGGSDTVMAIAEHAREAGWPEPLFGVSDEPSSREKSTHVTQIIGTQYAEARKQGVRTAVAGGREGLFLRPLTSEGNTIGDLYDVWIEASTSSDWPRLHEAAARNNAELWMYNCWHTGYGYLQERFHAGLWTWRTGVKGNGVWSYGWYVRINDSGLPESKIAWEGRLAGVNDYRYLQTLENTIRAGDASGKAGAAVQGARDFLETLRERVPYSVYRQRVEGIPQGQWAELDAWNPVPEIEPEAYDRIRDACTEHIIATRSECDLSE